MSENPHFANMPIMFSIYNNQFQPYLTRQNNYMQPDTYIMLYQACYKVLKRDEKS